MTTMDQAGLEMFAACVSANVRATEHATNRVIDNYERQIAALRREFVEFYELVDESAAVTTSRKLEAALAIFGVAYFDAAQALREAEK